MHIIKGFNKNKGFGKGIIAVDMICVFFVMIQKYIPIFN